MAAPDRRAVRVRIEGRVQGVGFRYWTEDQCNELGLAGWVRNRRDGSVEAVFSGDPVLIEEMLARCQRGPGGSRVTNVQVLGEEAEQYARFEIRPTA
jgi:acylphosphatase